MKGDSIRDLKIYEAVALNGHISKKDGDKVLVTFPKINTSVWVWERNVPQDFFRRIGQPAPQGEVTLTPDKTKSILMSCEEDTRLALQDLFVLLSRLSDKARSALKYGEQNEPLRTDNNVDILKEVMSAIHHVTMAWEEAKEGGKL